MNLERHPKELPFLFLTETWERFSFYLMLGLLTLFMISDKATGGLAFSKEHAATIFGTYIAMVYFTGFIGGIIADRVIGYRKAIILGGSLMCLGHISLAFTVESLSFFYLGLVLLIVGNGFFKTNISTLLGRLYPKDSKLRDAGFSIFYFGINLGALICNFVAAILRNKYGWHVAFGSAGVGMFIGILTFLFVYKSLGRGEIKSDERDQQKDSDKGLRTLSTKVLPAAVILAAMGYLAWGMSGAFFLASLPVLAFYFGLWSKIKKTEEKGSLGALMAMLIVLIPFWMVFQLYGTTQTFWAEENTVREIPNKSTEKILDSFYLLQHAPPSYFKNAAPDTPRPHKEWLKIISGTEKEIAAAKESYAKVLEESGDYLKAGPVPVAEEEYQTVYAKSDGKTFLAKGESLKLANAELFQSVNPFFVLLFTPFILWFWKILRRRGKEPSTPLKLAVGIVFGALYMYVMVLAVKYSDDGVVKQTAFWLIGSYAVVTIGELWLSPVGLSLVTKMAPARLGAVVMGGFFLTMAIGNKLSGIIGGMWDKVSRDDLFTILFIVMVLFAFIMFAMTPWLKKWMPKTEERK